MQAGPEHRTSSFPEVFAARVAVSLPAAEAAPWVEPAASEPVPAAGRPLAGVVAEVEPVVSERVPAARLHEAQALVGLRAD